MSNFTKPAKSIDDLYDTLIDRGLIIRDKSEVKKDLEHIGYFRLTGYLKYFQEPNDDFFEGITFKKVLDHYIFDRKLRLLTFDAIEKIEVSVKSSMNHYMATNFGIHWYLDTSLFQLTNIKKQRIYDKFIKKVKKIKSKPTSVFVKEYFGKYTSENFLPSWMLIEELTIGEISTVYNLLDTNHRVQISSVYNTYEKDFGTWLQLLNTLRNISAHHGRLWNRKYITKLKTADVIFKNNFHTKLNDLGNREVVPNYHNATLIMYYLLNCINENFGWLDDLNNLVLKYNGIIDINHMGFNSNWKENIEKIIK